MSRIWSCQSAFSAEIAEGTPPAAKASASPRGPSWAGRGLTRWSQAPKASPGWSARSAGCRGRPRRRPLRPDATGRRDYCAQADAPAPLAGAASVVISDERLCGAWISVMLVSGAGALSPEPLAATIPNAADANGKKGQARMPPACPVTNHQRPLGREHWPLYGASHQARQAANQLSNPPPFPNRIGPAHTPEEHHIIGARCAPASNGVTHSPSCGPRGTLITITTHTTGTDRCS